jgi:hypothetical protein
VRLVVTRLDRAYDIEPQEVLFVLSWVLANPLYETC